VDEAEASYVAAGGHLSPVSHFGSDPLADSPELIQQRHRAMQQNIPTPEELFAFTVNGDYMPHLHSPCSHLHISTERMRVYTVLAGLMVWEAYDCHVNVCEGLDWKRTFALHLWYHCQPSAPFRDALEELLPISLSGKALSCVGVFPAANITIHNII